MYLLKRNADFKVLSTFIRYYSPYKRSHYEILNLRRNCTDKEIKEAFILMSKEYHPDKNKDSRAQEQFVRIVEAYNVLSKPSSRRQYDQVMDFGSQPQRTTYQYYRPYYEEHTYNQHYNTGYSFYETKKSKAKDRTSTSTGSETQNKTKSVKKVPNYVIIMLCFGVAFVGTLLQMFVIRELYIVHRKQAQERSRFLSEELERVRSAAQGNNNEVQTRLLLERIVGAANPTIATASLGQALANEKKLAPETLLTEYGVAEVKDDIRYVNYAFSKNRHNRNSFHLTDL